MYFRRISIFGFFFNCFLAEPSNIDGLQRWHHKRYNNLVNVEKSCVLSILANLDLKGSIQTTYFLLCRFLIFCSPRCIRVVRCKLALPIKSVFRAPRKSDQSTPVPICLRMCYIQSIPSADNMSRIQVCSRPS